MGLVAEYRIEHPHLPLVEVASAVPAVELDLEVGQPNLAGPPAFVVRARGESLDDLEAALSASAFVEAFARVSEEGGRRRYRVRPSLDHWDRFRATFDDPAELRRLATNESVVERIEATPEGWVQKRWFADRAAFESYCEFWRENTAFVLERLSEDDRPDPRTVLTDAQREALVTAHEMGYFEVPRDTSLADVAEAVGVSEPSLSERLRRANANLVEYYADHLNPHRS
jgi:AcrR family transcriptional regulator